MDGDCTTPVELGLEATCRALNEGFADYFVKIPFTPAFLLQMARSDSLDLTVSRVMVREGRAVGVALIARRGWTCRLAAMAVVPEARRGGAGRVLVARLLEDAQARGDRVMVLEVIEQNEPAVRLYQTMGFQIRRRLVGYAGIPEPGARREEDLQPVDLRALGGAVTRHGAPDGPWQLSGETLAHLTPPACAWRANGAWIGLSNPEASPLAVRGWAWEGDPEEADDRLLGLLRTLGARFPGREFRVPAIWPEEHSGAFARAGLIRAPLTQWQMERAVAPIPPTPVAASPRAP